MSPEAVIGGLVHLSAVVTVITVAYVKLDKAHGGPDPLDDGLAAAKPIAEELILRLGLDKLKNASISDKWRLTTLFPACVICLVADKPIKLGFFRGPHFLYRQIHVPFLVYYRKHQHLWLVGFMALISTLMFFFFVAALIWDLNWTASSKIPQYTFFTLAGFCSWIFLSSAFCPLLDEKRLKAKCERLAKAVDIRFAKRLKRAERTVAAMKPPA
jgi:hypothetical protein